MGHDTVLQFLKSYVAEAEGEYESEVCKLSRWWHRNSPNKVFLSEPLAERLEGEMGLEKERRIKIDGDQLIAIVGGVYVLAKQNPEFALDFVVDVHSNYLVGWNSLHPGPYESGLNPPG